MYALSNAAPFSFLRLATFSSPPDFRLWLVGLSCGVTFSLVTNSTACLLTPVWSVTMRLANAFTSLLADVESASLPASMSTWLAVTTIDAICASFGAWAATTVAARNSDAATIIFVFLMARFLDGWGTRHWMQASVLAFPRGARPPRRVIPA